MPNARLERDQSANLTMLRVSNYFGGQSAPKKHPRAVPSRWNGSGHAIVDWSLGRAWRRTESQRPLRLSSMRTNIAISKQRDWRYIEGERRHTRRSIRASEMSKSWRGKENGVLRVGPFGVPSSQECVFYGQVNFVKRYHIIGKHYNVNHVSPGMKALAIQEIRSR